MIHGQRRERRDNVDDLLVEQKDLLVRLDEVRGGGRSGGRSFRFAEGDARSRIPGGLCTGWNRSGPSGRFTMEGCIHYVFGLTAENPFRRTWNELGVDRPVVPVSKLFTLTQRSGTMLPVCSAATTPQSGRSRSSRECTVARPDARSAARSR